MSNDHPNARAGKVTDAACEGAGSRSPRQLLEAAAKAAGNGAEWYTGLGMGFADGPFPTLWNPLDDDGDALRLAVKLQFEIIPLEGGGVDVRRTTEDEPFGELLATEIGADPYNTTRRAIVRAAAALASAASVELAAASGSDETK